MNRQQHQKEEQPILRFDCSCPSDELLCRFVPFPRQYSRVVFLVWGLFFFMLCTALFYILYSFFYVHCPRCIVLVLFLTSFRRPVLLPIASCSLRGSCSSLLSFYLRCSCCSCCFSLSDFSFSICPLSLMQSFASPSLPFHLDQSPLAREREH